MNNYNSSNSNNNWSTMQQAKLNFDGIATGATIRKVYDYVQQHHSTAPQLLACVPTAIEATRHYAAQDYNNAASLSFSCYQYLQQLCLQDQRLPPINNSHS